MGKDYLKLSPQNLSNSFDFFVKWLIFTKEIHLLRIVVIIAAFQFNWAKMYEGLPSIETEVPGRVSLLGEKRSGKNY